MAGPQYPPKLRWPENVKRLTHLPPAKHRSFYNVQRFTLNVTRACMVDAGDLPSVRLFEAAACGTPIISDTWEGLDTFFKPGRDILLSRGSRQTLQYLLDLPEGEWQGIRARARACILEKHTAAHRAAEVESLMHL